MPSRRGSGSRHLMANPLWRDKCADAVQQCAPHRDDGPSLEGKAQNRRRQNYFLSAAGLAALSALALHSERNFLRSLPCRPLASASFEHSSEAAECGFSAFFSAGALASAFGASVLAAGAVVWAVAAPISSNEATAVAMAKAEILVMGAPRLGRRPQPSRRNAEPQMNGSPCQAFSPPQYFEGRVVLRVVASSGCARMGTADDCPKETKDDHSSQDIVCDCGVEFRCICGD